MSEFRQNLATKEWIIMAAERAARPQAFGRSRPPAEVMPAFEATCPFCPGNEAMTPPAVFSIPHEAATRGWDVRVIPNKFPALTPSTTEDCQRCATEVGPYLRREGAGHHEVVIETPLHNHDLPVLSVQHTEHVMRAYCERYNALKQFPSTELVVIFRNHGAKAGTSLIHPHSQIVASSVVPFPVRNRLYEGQRYFDAFGRCVYCDILRYELQDGSRIVMDNAHFVVIAPYASSVPYEMMVLPKRHHAAFGSIHDDELVDLAQVLHNLLARLWRLLDDPDYNFVIDTAPEHMAGVPFYHWHLEIYPKLTTPAGFEIGSGIGINIIAPETAAAQLREVDGSRVMLVEETT
jgi:UDPglucose--hexose-1-phosphate uridylyltransferase